MINKLSAPGKLYLLVTVLAFFIIGIGLYGISEMKAMNEKTKTLYADRVVPMEQLNTVRFNYLIGIIGSVEQAQTHRLGFKEAVKQIEAAETIIAGTWKEYLVTYLTPAEAKLVEQGGTLMSGSAATINELKLILKKEDGVSLDRMMSGGFYPAVKPVVDKMNELLDLQVKVGKEIYDDSTAAYQRSFKRFILLIVLSLAFALPFCYYLVKKVNVLIKDLYHSNIIIARSEKKWRALIESAGDAIFILNTKTIITDVNDYASRLLGYSKKELIGMEISAFLSPEDLPKQVLFYESVRKNIAPLTERRLRRKDGSEVDIEVNARVLEGEGFISIVRDITERKKAEERIRQSEENYRQLFKLSPASMCVLEEGTQRFLEVNQASVNHYGYSEEEFATMTFANINVAAPADILINDILYHNNPNPSFLRSGRHVKKSGEIMDVETSSLPIMLNGKKQILVVAIDVTEKNRYEQQLTRAAIKAQEEERYEIGGELHDNVCQLLAGSLLTLGMIKKPIPPEPDEFFEKTRQYIHFAATEIRNLSHRLAPAFFDEATLADAFDDLLKSVNPEKKYTIALDFDSLTKNYAFGRELQLNLYRILQEQLRNILKYAFATRINVNVHIYEGVLEMSISDNGVGFDMAGRKRGIGFANMNRRAQLFSGHLIVESSPGNGCEIIVKIPLPKFG